MFLGLSPLPLEVSKDSFLLQSLQATRGSAGHAHIATLTAVMRREGLTSAEYSLD